MTHRLKFIAGEFEYKTGQTQYVYELEHETSDVSIRISASEMVELSLEERESQKLLPVWSGTECDLLLITEGFSALHLGARAKAQIAVKASIRGKMAGEFFDFTPIAVSMEASTELPLKEQMRSILREFMLENGLTPDLLNEIDLSPLDGDFDEEDDEEIPNPHRDDPDSEGEIVDDGDESGGSEEGEDQPPVEEGESPSEGA